MIAGLLLVMVLVNAFLTGVLLGRYRELQKVLAETTHDVDVIARTIRGDRRLAGDFDAE